jgi:hypothetical protein
MPSRLAMRKKIFCAEIAEKLRLIMCESRCWQWHASKTFRPPGTRIAYRSRRCPARKLGLQTHPIYRMEPGATRHAGIALFGVSLAVWARPVFRLGLCISCALERPVAASAFVSCRIRPNACGRRNFYTACFSPRRQVLAAIGIHVSRHDFAGDLGFRSPQSPGHDLSFVLLLSLLAFDASASSETALCASIASDLSIATHGKSEKKLPFGITRNRHLFSAG